MSRRVLTVHVPPTFAHRTRARTRAATRHALTLEGLADADAGRTVAHEDVLRWAQTLPGRRRQGR